MDGVAVRDIGLQKLMASLKFRQRVEESSVVLHFFVFIGLAFLAFSNNSSCLFFTLDGSYWAFMHDLQVISRAPFTQLGADPVQGSFDAYVPPFREYLLPNLMAMPFSAGSPAKVLTYTVYAGLMILSVYLLARALRVDRAPALFAGLLYPLFTLPMFIGSLPASHPVYALAPHATEVTSLTLLTLACFWALERQTFFRSLLLALAALFCSIWMILSSTAAIVLSIPTLLFFGVASLLSAPRWQQDVGRAVTCRRGLSGYHCPQAPARILVRLSGLHGDLSCLGIHHKKVGGQLPGPSLVDFEFVLWPLNRLFAAIAFFAAIDAVVFCRDRCGPTPSDAAF